MLFYGLRARIYHILKERNVEKNYNNRMNLPDLNSIDQLPQETRTSSENYFLKQLFKVSRNCPKDKQLKRPILFQKTVLPRVKSVRALSFKAHSAPSHTLLTQIETPILAGSERTPGSHSPQLPSDYYGVSLEGSVHLHFSHTHTSAMCYRG